MTIFPRWVLLHFALRLPNINVNVVCGVLLLRNRARAVYEPRSVLEEFGTVLPKGVAVRVHDSTADLRYLVLPRRPEGTEGWTEEELAATVTRDSMIGVREAKKKENRN